MARSSRACRQRVRYPAQQDLAQQRAAAVQHQQHPQRCRPPHPRAGRDRAGSKSALPQGEKRARRLRRVKSLMTDVPDLPNFSRFHEAFRSDAETSTPEGTCAQRSSAPTMHRSVNTCRCLVRTDCLRDGPDMVSANFVIPYPPGFLIMVSGSGADAGVDRLHAPARCEGDPRLRESQGSSCSSSTPS